MEDTSTVETVIVDPVMVENTELFVFTTLILIVDTVNVEPTILENVVVFTSNVCIIAVDVTIVLP